MSSNPNEPDLTISADDIEPGRSGDCLRRSIAALRADSKLITLLGDASRIIPATDDDEPTPVLLAVEVIAAGSEQSGAVEEGRRTVEVAPLLSPSAFSEADPLYLSTVRDRAITVLREGIGPGWSFMGATDDISFREPRTAEDIDALVQYVGRAQFRVDITRDNGAP